MPSFSDSIFLFVLALLLFGPKRLPVLARELGKWMGEFRRASNEFKMQMEEELRISEQTDRQKQIAAMEAAAPVTPPIAEPEQEQIAASSSEAVAEAAGTPATVGTAEMTVTENAAIETVAGIAVDESPKAAEQAGFEAVDGVRTPLPIATSGEMRMMPPATGLPMARKSSGSQDSHNGSPNGNQGSALEGLLDSLPAADDGSEAAAEATAHGR